MKRSMGVVWAIAPMFSWCTNAAFAAGPDEIYVENCGLNVTYLVLKYFDCERSIERIASDLGVGDRFTNFVSLADIRRCLTQHGVKAEGYKVQTPADLVDQLEGETAVIAFSRRGDQDSLGHFTFLARGGSGGVIVADPPQTPQRLTRPAMVEWLTEAGATGEFLLVGKLERREAKLAPELRIPLRRAEGQSKHLSEATTIEVLVHLERCAAEEVEQLKTLSVETELLGESGDRARLRLRREILLELAALNCVVCVEPFKAPETMKAR